MIICGTPAVPITGMDLGIVPPPLWNWELSLNRQGGNRSTNYVSVEWHWLWPQGVAGAGVKGDGLPWYRKGYHPSLAQEGQHKL